MNKKHSNTQLPHSLLWKRIVLLMIGLAIAHLGVTLFLQADLGSDPFNVLIQGIYRAVPWPAMLHWSHGRTHVLTCFVIICLLLLIDRHYIKVGTILCMALGGPIIDMFTRLLGGIINASLPMPVRVLLLACGCIILAFGMTIVIQSDAGTGPNDLVSIVISDKTKKSFGIVRILTDICFVAAGCLLGGTFGAGTVICAFLVGPSAQLLMPYSAGIARSFIGDGQADK